MSVLKPVVLLACFMGAVARAPLCFADDDAKAHLREKVPTAIAEAIRMLEAKEYEDFLKEFVSPKDLKTITEKIPVSTLATQFKGAKADTLLRTLKSIKDRQPTLEEGGSIAAFPVTVAGAPRSSIKFIKVGKYWYIQN